MTMADGQITYLGHSTFRLTLPDGRVIFVDPWLAENPRCPDSEKAQSRCDFIVTTHGHFDHVADVAALAAEFKPKVVAMFELANLLSEHAPGGEYLGMGLGGTQEVDGIRFSLTRAYHSSGFQTAAGLLYGGTPAGVVIEAPGLAALYHAGDTDVFSDMKLINEFYAPKILMLPMGDHFTMGPRGAAAAARFFDASAIVPMHYSTFPLLTGTVEAFREHLGPDLSAKLLPMEPGQTVKWSAGGAH